MALRPAILAVLLFSLLTPQFAVAAEKPVLCLAYDQGGRGDQSFNDATALGVSKAEKNISFSLETVVTDGTSADREKRLRSLLAKNCQLLIAIGAGYAPAINVLSTEFPEINFAILNDASVESANVASLIFSQTQSAFLAGITAALASKSGKVAMIAMPDQSSSYELGFKAGVLAAKKKVSTLVRYLSEGGQPETRALIAAGVDVIYLALPGSNSAVFKTIVSSNTQKNRLNQNQVGLIGVAPDQVLLVSPANQKFIYATVVKRVDIAIQSFIEKSLAGRQSLDILDGDKGIYGIRYGISGGTISLTTFLPSLTAVAPLINKSALQAPKLAP